MKINYFPKLFNDAKYTFSKWNWLWLWILPTFETESENLRLKFKRVNGVTYLISAKKVR